jgi:hypothetical protein
LAEVSKSDAACIDGATVYPKRGRKRRFAVRTTLGNAIYVLLTATVQNRLSWISAVYDPT